jgi:hypothetical protein
MTGLVPLLGWTVNGEGARARDSAGDIGPLVSVYIHIFTVRGQNFLARCMVRLPSEDSQHAASIWVLIADFRAADVSGKYFVRKRGHRLQLLLYAGLWKLHI